MDKLAPHSPPASSPGNPKVADSEKVTINLGFVDLGQIDLLVSEGFHGNRTDFIRTAIRNQLSSHSDAVKQVVARKMLVLGLATIAPDVLGALHASPAVKAALANRRPMNTSTPRAIQTATCASHRKLL